jgi:hypothetical protein
MKRPTEGEQYECAYGKTNAGEASSGLQSGPPAMVAGAVVSFLAGSFSKCSGSQKDFLMPGQL